MYDFLGKNWAFKALSNLWLKEIVGKFRLCVIITFGFYEKLLSEIGHCVTQVEIEKGSLKGVSPISLIKFLTECCIKFSTYSGLKPLYIF